jgi:hypothetical protein
MLGSAHGEEEAHLNSTLSCLMRTLQKMVPLSGDDFTAFADDQ